MDNRRLDTAGFMAMGGLSLPVPQTDIPNDRDRADHDEVRGEGQLIAAIEGGKVVSASNYYGIPYAWRAQEGVYRGQLLQYRRVTEDVTFATANEIADWFESMAAQTDG